MAKETFFFSHDYNARNDRKMVKLKHQLKMSGVGIYWCIVEMLFEDNGKIQLDEIPTIAAELKEKDTNVLRVINDFDLFKSDGKYFWSESVNNRLAKRKEKSEKAALSVQKRWKNTNVLQTNNDSNTIKESKVKESKDDVEVKPPTSTLFSLKDFKEQVVIGTNDFTHHAIKRTRQQPEELTKLRDQFLIDMLSTSKFTWPNITDAKNHFINWVNKQPKASQGYTPQMMN